MEGNIVNSKPIYEKIVKKNKRANKQNNEWNYNQSSTCKNVLQPTRNSFFTTVSMKILAFQWLSDISLNEASLFLTSKFKYYPSHHAIICFVNRITSNILRFTSDIHTYFNTTKGAWAWNIHTSNWDSSAWSFPFLFLIDTRSPSLFESFVCHNLIVLSQEPEQT